MTGVPSHLARAALGNRFNRGKAAHAEAVPCALAATLDREESARARASTLG
jgi:hypothetical protein